MENFDDQQRQERGYSRVSLDMLKTDEGETNAVFSCFGAAAQHAQIFEEGLAKFLVVYNLLAAKAVTLEDLES
jgi:hypothetical protein